MLVVPILKLPRTSNSQIFDNAKAPYEAALKQSGHPSELKFDNAPEPTTNQNCNKKRKNRNRNTIYFCPPFNLALKTDLGKQFLSLIDKHFSKNHPLHPVINRKNTKISYGCCPNVENIMTSHNKKITKPTGPATDTKKCNCINADKCPLDGNCCVSSVIYKATIENPKAFYIGMTAGKFKNRYNQHKHSFKAEARKFNTTLSAFVWSKGLTPEPEIKWTIVKKCGVYKPGDSTCGLCSEEKSEILKHMNDPACINKRNDVSTRCVHMKGHGLGAIT